mmetsp:Transcript_19526/g.40447  ORF Transcript_19526/g.40447 Transcript_19526/m.40447 type:complete len:121 (-) Transcript_19526:207-569(-)
MSMSIHHTHNLLAFAIFNNFDSICDFRPPGNDHVVFNDSPLLFGSQSHHLHLRYIGALLSPWEYAWGQEGCPESLNQSLLLNGRFACRQGRQKVGGEGGPYHWMMDTDRSAQLPASMHVT